MKIATFASGADPGASIVLGPGVLAGNAPAGSSPAKMVLMRPQHEETDDGTLVRLSLSGDGKAYELLVRRYQKLVYNVLYQMVRHHETAADLTQETFLRAFRGLAGFRAGAPFKPWLLRIATNCGLNWIRDCRPQDSLDELLEEDPGAEPLGRQDVESEVSLRLSQALLWEALAQLPVRHRHVFVLRYQHDLSYEEIASITGDPETTIKSLLHRVRERLRLMLCDKMKAEH
ncbi:MAG TPA: sigma-70 family RNA polymerase sigma factor [Candidatus Obscuribacterales bacterium]